MPVLDKEQEIAMLRSEVEMLVQERARLLRVGGAAAVFIANMDIRNYRSTCSMRQTCSLQQSIRSPKILCVIASMRSARKSPSTRRNGAEALGRNRRLYEERQHESRQLQHEHS
jgi:hypothetical protein